MTDESDGDDDSATVTARFAVPEMDCPSCAQKVDRRLQRVKGVSDSTLHPTTGIATITYDPDYVTEAEAVDAIEQAGYTVANTETETATSTTPGIAPASALWTSRRAIGTWIGAVALVFGLLMAFVLGDRTFFVVQPLGTAVTGADMLFLGATLVSGLPVIRNGYYSARARSLDIDLLMGTAIIAATGIGYFVEAATLAVLFSVAELLEDYAMDRARTSLRELMDLSPETATVRRGDEERTVPAEAVTVGETVVVRPGERIPLDGVVREGQSAVDESPITGESVPVDKHPGDEVYAGSINTGGYLEFEATAAASDSTLAQIIDLVQGAREQKTEKEQFVDRFAGYYTPIVVVLAVLTAVLPPLVITGNATVTLAGFTHTVDGAWQTWFIRGLTLLVIACPCAFVISTPVSVVSGITSAAKHGVLIKGGNHLETMGAVNAVAIDKTGTLTTGELAVTDVVPLGDASETTVLRRAAALEQRSEHPIAEAIRTAASDSHPDQSAVEAFESITGQGVRAEIDGETWYAGNPGLFTELGFDLAHTHLRTDGGRMIDPVEEPCEQTGCADIEHGAIAQLESDGKTVVLVGTATRLIGVIGIADELRPEAEHAVARLHEHGIEHVAMLTGDNEGTARAIAQQAGVDDYRAELLPEEKVDAVAALARQYGEVAMIGDGINDAPALASADVGIAMGAAGTDTAIETADIALMGDDLGKVPYLYRLSQRANRVIRQNIWSSLGVKAVLALGVPLGLVSVALAVVVGDMGMSLSVTGNAMRLSRTQPDDLSTE